MDFRIGSLTVKKLISLYEEKKLNLNPPYQRNDIWTKKAKSELIDSIQKGYPLPTFFLFKKGENNFEMVDGQQRTRTLIGYSKGFIQDLEKKFFDRNNGDFFWKYKLPVVIIENISKYENIEDFYSRVNSKGLRMNKPELNKAEYFNTRFLKLIEEIAESKEFEILNLFTEASKKRMSDKDLVGELIAQIEVGISDKKDKMENLFKSDISEKKKAELFNVFFRILKHFNRFNEIHLIKDSRYKQRNDFYTFFGFVHKNLSLKDDTFDYFYKILLFLGNEISPSSECEPLQEYAFNCVSQSNSKTARQKRYHFLEDLFLNQTEAPNEVQNKILEFYGLEGSAIVIKEGFTNLDFDKLVDALKLKETQKNNDHQLSIF